MINRAFLWLLMMFPAMYACSSPNKIIEIEERSLPTIIISGDEEDKPKKYKPEATRLFDLIHTKLDITLDIPNEQVHGKAEISAKPYFYSQKTLVLDAKGYTIHSVQLMNSGVLKTLTYDYDGHNLSIDLDKEYTRNEEITVLINYTANPPKYTPPAHDAASTDEGLYFIDPTGTDPLKPTQVWSQGETEANSIWFPTIDKPNQKMTQEIYVTVPDKYVTLSNGALLSSTTNTNGTRTDYWKQELPHPPYLTALIVGDYAIVKDSWKGKSVDYYVEPEYEHYAKDIFGNTPEMLEFYSKLFDYPFPWEKYSQIIVRDFTAGAMENTGAVTFHENYQKTKRELLDGTGESTIAHEVIHQWFGNIVTCESWANLAMNESFANYGEYLWKEHKYGKEEADYHLNNDLRGYLNEANEIRVPIVRFYVEHRDDMFDAHSYNKGCRVLHMLRNEVGDDAFFTALGKFLKDNEFKPGEFHQLRLSFEEVTGRDLNWFFNQWFFEAGHPELEVATNYDSTKGAVTIAIKQIQNIEESSLFRLPLSVDIYVNNTPERYEIVVDQQKHEFTFKVAAKPQLVNVDAKKILLGEITEKKTLAEWKVQYEMAPLFLDRYQAISEIAKMQDEPGAKETLHKALHDPFHAIRRIAIDKYKFFEKAPEPVKQRLRDIALSDPKSAVRRAAIRKLRVINDDLSWQIVNKAFNDQSYQVAGTALGLYTDHDMQVALEQANVWKDEKNDDLKVAVAEVYAESGDAEYAPYFNKLFNELPGFKKYSLVNRYRKFVEKLHGSDLDNGIKNLSNIAENDKPWWMRHAGMEALKKLEDKLTVRSKNGEDLQSVISKLNSEIIRIKEGETHERLRAAYDKDDD